MLDWLLQFLFGSLIVVQAVFWPMFLFQVLPTLGDRQIKVRYGLRDLLLNTYIDKYVEAYLQTLDPVARNRWHNRFVRYAMSASFVLIVLIGSSLLAGRALGA